MRATTVKYAMTRQVMLATAVASQSGALMDDGYSGAPTIVNNLDADQHLEASLARRDERRTAYLEAQSLRVLRFTDREVLQQLDAVVDAVFAAVSAASKSP